MSIAQSIAIASMWVCAGHMWSAPEVNGKTCFWFSFILLLVTLYIL